MMARYPNHLKWGREMGSHLGREVVGGWKPRLLEG